MSRLEKILSQNSASSRGAMRRKMFGGPTVQSVYKESKPVYGGAIPDMTVSKISPSMNPRVENATSMKGKGVSSDLSPSEVRIENGQIVIRPRQPINNVDNIKKKQTQIINRIHKQIRYKRPAQDSAVQPSVQPDVQTGGRIRFV